MVGRHGERQKVITIVDVGAVDCVDQTDACDLNEVVDELTTTPVAASDVIGQRQTPLDYGAVGRAVGYDKTALMFIERRY